ncbi:MAG: tryptophan synthase subunit alpha [Chitinophagaceae bacterium]
MSRIEQLFQKKKNNILSIYFTAGFPELNSTLLLLKFLQQRGADMVEIGIPYSDPLADGPVIQQSSSKALQNGMTIETLFAQLNDFRKDASLADFPVILMGYLNPVLQYGFEKFCSDASSLGVDGLIIPDLPQHEFEREYGSIIRKYGLNFSFLVAPETGNERIKKLDELSSGFLYAVSSSSTTGSQKNLSDVESFLKRLNVLQLKKPVLAGFGIKDKQSFEAVCQYAHGGIIGTAFIKAIADSKNLNQAVDSFLKSLK